MDSAQALQCRCFQGRRSCRAGGSSHILSPKPERPCGDDVSRRPGNAPPAAGRSPRTDDGVTAAGALGRRSAPQQTAEAFFDRAGRAVQSLYGSTETGGIAVDVHAERSTTMGCVGPAMESVSVEVGPATELGTSESVNGAVRVKSTSMMAGYLTPEGIDSSHIVEGWFQTGDLGYLDDAGRIHLVGRESEVINVFGLKVIEVRSRP